MPSSATIWSAAGFVGLVKAVKRMAEKGRGVKAVEYICVVVANEIGALARQEGTIRIPPTAQKDAAAAGKPIKPMKAANELLPGLHADNIESAVDMFDLISSCCCTETERKYVEMRQAGYTLQEIADEVHTSLSAIYTHEGRPLSAHAEEGRLEARQEGEEMTSSLETLVRERIKEFEIRDLIASCCTCPKERTFVEMRERPAIG